MGLGGWFTVPFGTSAENSRGESSACPDTTSTEAGVDDSNRGSERQDQQGVAFDPQAPRVALPMEPQQAFTIDAGQELPLMNVPQPYVNPIPGIMERPDPGLSEEERKDAYAKLMRRFQVGDLEV